MNDSTRRTGIVGMLLLVAMNGQLAAQFVTVVNSPPERVPRSLGPGTQLNLFDGGVIRSSYSRPFRVGRGSNSNVELNIYGGDVREQLEARFGGRVNIYGGDVDLGFHATEGSEVTIAGGRVADWFEAGLGGTVTLSGGVVGSGFIAGAGSQVSLLGNAFELNGQPINTDTVSLTGDQVLSGILQDGTPFVFSPLNRDYLEEVTIVRTELPEFDLTPIMLDSDQAPLGLTPGQTLYLEEGGSLPDDFAVVDATLHINSGHVGDLEVVGSEVNFGAGSIRGDFHAYHGTMAAISSSAAVFHIEVFGRTKAAI